MSIGSRKKNKSVADFMFFSGLLVLSIVILIIMVTLKNECIFLRNEVYHFENIKTSHLNRVKILAGNIKNMSRQDRIEQLAYENFQLHVPAPESLIIYLGDIK